MRVLIVALLLAGCTASTPAPPRDWHRPMKDCMNDCLGSTFAKFHHEGHSWGTGSSSMNGLSQEKIFDRALAYCKEFYEGEKCCAFNYHYSDGENSIRPVFGFSTGPCVTPKGEQKDG